jgi:hypothetical protein
MLSTHYIPCKTRVCYSFSNYANNNFSGCVCFYDKDKNFLSGINGIQAHTYIQTPNSAKFFKMKVDKQDIGKLSIVEGTIPPPHYLPYNETVSVIDKFYTKDITIGTKSLADELDTIAKVPGLENKTIELETEVNELTDKINGSNYTTELTEVPLNVTNIYHCNTQTDTFFATVDELYTAYDSFLTHKNVSKKLIGYGSTAEGTNDTTLPIYSYTIGNPFSGDIVSAPKILLTSGIHGSEKTAIMGLYRFVESLFDDSNDNAVALRNSLSFEIVPCINPWGYNYTGEGASPIGGIRYNARNVDLNRNFSNNWESKKGANGGAAPYSELETQALRDWLDENTDAVLHIDCHNHGDSSRIFYIASNSDKQKKLFSGTIRKISTHIKTTFNLELSTATHFIEANTIPGVCAESYEIYKIDGGIVETPNFFNSEHIKPTADLIGNYLIEAIKNYKY